MNSKNSLGSFKKILGIVFIAAGAVLAVFFWDVHVKWFQGGHVGLLLILLGVMDLWEDYRSSKGKKSKSIMDELREEIGSLDPNRKRHDDERH
ncbi:hypothetical protein J7E88_05535 [Streptomyces sp. ISL-10]|uniref:hypothetical protein n=1 Tax=Streptomyces sp. ISL-10 TaxID=2819172 RepID=UPI001BEB51DD|nr:hypothetical protein [Streptomyces sp. ISL-10]MBT2364794.1 hypothetical protein [Streptomyces sp. ISL-10]